jgi:hypothetical protein
MYKGLIEKFKQLNAAPVNPVDQEQNQDEESKFYKTKVRDFKY